MFLGQSGHARTEPHARLPPKRTTRWRLSRFWAALVVWSAAVAAGMGWLTFYANQAGEAGAAPEKTAVASRDSFRLWMFVHPRCPCSMASMNELARIMSRGSQSVEATVFFIQPETASDDWAQGALWDAAAAIPGIHVQADIGGRTAAQFGAATSGDVLLYDASGQLRFHGGITSARGHEGDNLGKSAVLAIVRGGSTDVDVSPVFGCALRATPSLGGK